MLPRCRPSVESLECRLAPSLTPIFETPVAAIVQAPFSLAIHATDSTPAPSTAVVAAEASPTSPVTRVLSADRAEFFARTFAQPAPEQSPLEVSREAATITVRQIETPLPARAGQPLLVWVLGMTCLLMLSWERHVRKPTLRHDVARRTRWAKSLSDLSAMFARVWRPRARSACA
jgi:hypothetical protein